MTTSQGDHDRSLPRVGTVLRPTVASVVLLFYLGGLQRRSRERLDPRRMKPRPKGFKSASASGPS